MVKSFNDNYNRNQTAFSLRMRASMDGMHISGAERILSEDKLPSELVSLFNRAINHGIGTPDEIYFSVEEIKEDILFAGSLPISTILTEGSEDSRRKTKELLKLHNISEKTISKAFNDISKGASPDSKNMRGAIVIDIDTGERLEPDPYRGVRVSRMDICEEAEDTLSIEMKRIDTEGLRVKEALILATKVSMAGTVAELCWSDNPDYTTGYVASKRYGYVRFPDLKKKGDIKGGRAFFFKGQVSDIYSYINFLQKRPVLIERVTQGFRPCTWEEFLSRTRRDEI
ncbi:MAG: 6-carboxyhexanoate--CoA ligase [Nitrospirota bacterium]